MRAREIQGFTLIELVVTIAVAAILLTIALPSFQSTMRSNRMSAASNELLGSIALARSEAIRNTRGAGVCAANAAGTDCDKTAKNWSHGWLVWTDATASLGFDSGTDTVVRNVQAENGVVVTASATGDLRFDNRGLLASGGINSITLAPAKCPSKEEAIRILSLTAVGQASIAKGKCP